MKRAKGFSLQFLVSVLVVSSVLVTIAVGTLVGYRNEKDSLIRVTLQMNRFHAEKIADSVDSLFAMMKQKLEASSARIPQLATRAEYLAETDRLLLNNPNFNSTFIADKEGVILARSPDSPEYHSLKLQSVGVLQALQERKPLVSEPFYSTMNRFIVMVSQPIFDKEGVYQGFIAGTIWLQEKNLFNTLLAVSPHISNGSYTYVVDSSGSLIFHPDHSRIGQSAAQNPAVQDLMQGNNGQRRVTNTQGADMLASYTHLKEAGWGVVSQTPTERVLSESQVLILKVPLYTLPVMTLFILLIYRVIGKMSAPLSDLAKYAAKLTSHGGNREAVPVIHGWSYEANQLRRALEIAVGHLRDEFDHVSLEAQTDPLTGLPNRRVMTHVAESWIVSGTPFCLLIADLDHFKKINDTYGHDAGDEVLRHLAEILKQAATADTVCCRYGGEEFIVLRRCATLEEARLLAESLRFAMEASAIESIGGRPVTLSVGIAAFPDSANHFADLFRMADEALYEAKKSGRNRVEFK